MRCAQEVEGKFVVLPIEDLVVILIVVVTRIVAVISFL
jgi:hypothetical protein